ncbi:MAG TPA: hypothetical protein PLT92_13095 [Ignavibacteriaceae bacterium]|nr:hypothetical protein [Ignavibacteriaceae bacterium]HPO56368.1 hypothetical protein [Ignavibacteriaceae bacterium]
MRRETAAVNLHIETSNPRIISIRGEDKNEKCETDFHEEEEVQNETNQFGFIKFWTRNDKGTIIINPLEFKRFLQANGFFKIKSGNSVKYVRLQNSIADEISIYDFKDFTIQFLENLPPEALAPITKKGLFNAIVRRKGEFLCNSFLDLVDTIQITLIKDTKDTSFLFYSNGILKVTKDKTELIPYAKSGSNTWRKHIKEREFLYSEKKSEFETFVWNAVGKSKERFHSFMTGFGYLLHRYKDRRVPKAVVICDEKMSESANGRNGKGLIAQALGHLRNVVNINAKEFNITKSFPWQLVNPDTQLLFLDDINPKFIFRQLFSFISEGMQIEKKYQDAQYIPYEDAPKVGITSNHVIEGLDGSSRHRQFFIELTDYYNDKYTVGDEFKKEFFRDWSPDEFAAFDNFAVKCIQTYLKDGLVPYNEENIMMKKLRNETSDDFVDFMEDEENVKIGVKYDKKKLFENFTAQYKDNTDLTQKTFTIWIKKYSFAKGLAEPLEKPSGKNKYITLRERKTKKTE